MVERFSYWGKLNGKRGGEWGDQSLGTGTKEEERERYREIREEEVEIGGVLPVKWTGYACVAHRRTLQGPQGAGLGVPGC